MQSMSGGHAPPVRTIKLPGSVGIALNALSQAVPSRVGVARTDTSAAHHAQVLSGAAGYPTVGRAEGLSAPESPGKRQKKPRVWLDFDGAPPRGVLEDSMNLLSQSTRRRHRRQRRTSFVRYLTRVRDWITSQRPVVWARSLSNLLVITKVVMEIARFFKR